MRMLVWRAGVEANEAGRPAARSTREELLGGVCGAGPAGAEFWALAENAPRLAPSAAARVSLRENEKRRGAGEEKGVEVTGGSLGGLTGRAEGGRRCRPPDAGQLASSRRRGLGGTVSGAVFVT